MKHLWKKGILTLLMALMVAMAAPSILSSETSMTTVEAAQMKINAKKATLIKGQTGKLKIKNATSTVKWTSSNSNVAYVNKNGKVTALKKGTATITAKAGDQKFTCKVTVENPKISQTSLKLTKGDTAKLKITGTSQTVKWSSSDKSVVQVNKNGKIAAMKKGTAVITATVGGKKYKCTVKVKGASSTEQTSSLDVTVLSMTDITYSPVSTIKLKIKNNGTKTVKIGNYTSVQNCTYATWLGNSTNATMIPFGSGEETYTSIAPGKTVTVTISSETYAFKGNSSTYYYLWFYIGNTQYRYDFYPVTGKGKVALVG